MRPTEPQIVAIWPFIAQCANPGLSQVGPTPAPELDLLPSECKDCLGGKEVQTQIRAPSARGCQLVRQPVVSTLKLMLMPWLGAHSLDPVAVAVET